MRVTKRKNTIPVHLKELFPLVSVFASITIIAFVSRNQVFQNTATRQKVVYTPTPTSGYLTDNEDDGVLTDYVAGFRVKYPEEYSPKMVGRTWDLVLRTLTEKDYGRAGNIFFVTDYYISTKNLAFERTLRTENGYDAIQRIYIFKPDSPFGLGKVETTINAGLRVITIITFIGGYLEDIQIDKDLSALTEEDYLDILDSKLRGYQLVVKTLQFIR